MARAGQGITVGEAAGVLLRPGILGEPACSQRGSGAQEGTWPEPGPLGLLRAKSPEGPPWGVT